MIRHPWLLASGLAWALMMGLLFDREVRPYFEYQAPPTYAAVFRDRTYAEAQRRAVFFAESRIGTSESLSEPLEDGGARFRSRLRMAMTPFMGKGLPLDDAFLSSEFRIGPDARLAQFRMAGNLQGIPISAQGERQGEQLRVGYTLLLMKGDLLVPFPKDATLADSFVPYQGGGRLEDGKKWKMRIFDPGALVAAAKDKKVEVSELYATVVGREKPPTRPGEQVAWLIEVRREPAEPIWDYLIWVDDDGLVLEQHMKINKLLCKVVLEERLKMSPDEAKSYPWKVEAAR